MSVSTTAARDRVTVVLLTGFPTFRARRVCEALLAEDDVEVHAVVRTKFMADARTAVASMGERGSRVSLIEGDSAALDMGLSGRELKELTHRVEIIHHAAQVTYLNVDKELARQVNVDGAREALEVAERCKNLRCLVIHSSATVSGSFEGRFHEADLDVGQSFRNAVESTLARAERMARDAMSQLPIAVVRPGVIVGDSRTGEIDRLDGPYYLMMLMLTSPPEVTLPLPGKGDAPLHVVPIDFVAAAAAIVGRDPRSPGKTFHLADPNPLPAKRVFELFAAAAGRRTLRGFFPSQITSALLRTPGLERFATSQRSLIEVLGTSVVYDTRNADAALGALRCPPFASYVETLVSHVQGRLKEKQRVRDDADDTGLGA